MATIPITKRAVLVRTDFSNDAAWQAVCGSVFVPGPEMMQAFDFIKMANAHPQEDAEMDISLLSIETLDDEQFNGTTPGQLLEKLPEKYPHTYLFMFDGSSASDVDRSVLVIDLFHEHGRTFRTIPAEVQCIDSNLSIPKAFLLSEPPALAWSSYDKGHDEHQDANKRFGFSKSRG